MSQLLIGGKRMKCGELSSALTLQRFTIGPVDRRFNRARYDADVALAAFAAGLKDAVDLDSIRDDLATVVRQALAAAHVPVRISQRLRLASATSPPWSLSVIMRTTDDAVHH
jgi:hypothetical protein